MESFTMSLKPKFGCMVLASALAPLRLGELFSGLCTKSSSLMYGGSCWTDLLPSIDEKDEHEEEEQEALDDSIERLLFSVMLLLNVFSRMIFGVLVLCTGPLLLLLFGGVRPEGGGRLLQRGWRLRGAVSIRWRSKIWKMPAMQPMWRSSSGMSSSAAEKALSTLLAGGIDPPKPIRRRFLHIHRLPQAVRLRAEQSRAEQEKVPIQTEEEADDEQGSLRLQLQEDCISIYIHGRSRTQADTRQE